MLDLVTQFPADPCAVLCQIEDILALAAENTRPFASLASLTLTLPQTLSPASWSIAFRSLTARSPLAEFYLYTIGEHLPGSHDLSGFVDSVLDLHAVTLRKFSFHRLRLQPAVVGTICASCPSLETLFVVVESSHLVRLTITF